MWLTIEANDVLMFRDSKPFAAGQSFVARSTFPPNPQVMTGAIRSAVVDAKGVSFHDYRDGKAPQEIYEKIGNPSQLGSLKLRGPFVCKISSDNALDILLPLPQDVLHDERQKLFVTMQPSRKVRNNMQTESPFEGWIPLALPPLKDDADYSFENTSAWLPSATFQAYLEGHRIASEQVIRNEAVFQLEGHMGLGLDYNRRAADEANRLLYRAEFARPYASYDGDYQIRLLLEVNDGLLPQQGHFTIGGESRFCAYKAVDYSYPLTIPAQHEGRLKIVLLTPAYFKEGWQPENGNWSQWLGEKAKLVSIAAASPTIISGWDMAARNGRGQAKPLYRYMPVGTVYYFENAEIPTRPFTESPSELDAGQMGFGGFAVGTWDYLD